jgi:hypothetical protein
MLRLLVILLISGCVSKVAHGQQLTCPETGAKPGDEDNYSQLSVRLCWQDFANGKRHLRIWSPDHSVLLSVDGKNGELYKNGRALGKRFEIGDEEWLWSPDSRAIILTTHLGNAGEEIASVDFIPKSAGIAVPEDMMKTIQKHFATRHPQLKCVGDTNVGGLTWLDGSKKAVLIAEIPPSPHCERADGYFEAYVLSIPAGRILQQYSMAETVKRFGSILGPRLLGDVEEQKDEREGR